MGLVKQGGVQAHVLVAPCIMGLVAGVVAFWAAGQAGGVRPWCGSCMRVAHDRSCLPPSGKLICVSEVVIVVSGCGGCTQKEAVKCVWWSSRHTAPTREPTCQAWAYQQAPCRHSHCESQRLPPLGGSGSPGRLVRTALTTNQLGQVRTPRPDASHPRSVSSCRRCALHRDLPTVQHIGRSRGLQAAQRNH